MSSLLAEHRLGNMIARFIQPKGTKRCELQLVPASKVEQIREPRAFIEGRCEIEGLPAKFKPILADSPSTLVQVKLQEDNTAYGFASGMSMVESQTIDTLEFDRQEVQQEAGKTTVLTHLRDSRGRFRCVHRLAHHLGTRGVVSSVDFFNIGSEAVRLELLTSFALNGLTPFVAENVTPHLTFHRFRSWWSLEGRTDSSSLESLHLERSWGGFGLFSERFGQLGSMPVRRWFPCAAVEDRTAGVVWAAQIAWSGSWQMELYRKGDRVHLCGGLADREFGHWMKRVNPGETFCSPEAFLTTIEGTLDEATQALVSMQRIALESPPAVERELPVCFNEWCTSWGNPTHENILAIAERLKGSGVRYIVIDDGWAIRPPEALLQSNGDWVVDEQKFPGGLKPTCDALRAMGYIPGIWFEFEVINPGAEAWKETTHVVHRDGRPLQVGSRRFWDFRDPWVHDYLFTKVVRLLKENGIGYLKVDYNDNIGLGCDHLDSMGEGLREHLEGVQRFFRTLRREIPELVIENCSSGGHRLEPLMQGLTSMGSFSDAHEGVIIPIIARNLQRLILPQQSLIWAVLHRADDEARLHYSLASAFLGRLCLSGDIHDLEEWQMKIVRRGLSLYAKVARVIECGESCFYGSPENSYVDPVGWQAVVREWEGRALIVVHGMGLESSQNLRIPLPFEAGRISETFCDHATSAEAAEREFFVTLPVGFRGGVWLVEGSYEI